MPLVSEHTLFALKSFERGLFTSSLLRHRHWEAHISGMPQSGNHWLRYMLGLTIAKLHDLPPPAHIESVDYINLSRMPPSRHEGIPQIAWSHSLPNYLHRSRRVVEGLNLPNNVIVVRDIVESLVSSYAREPEKYHHDFSAYLRGKHGRKGFMVAAWRRVMFCNAWGPVVERFPERCCVVRYEDMKADTAGELGRVCAFVGMGTVSAEILAESVAQSTKSKMAALPNPEDSQSVISKQRRRTEDWFSAEDAAYVDAILRKNLKYSFGYDYTGLTAG